MCGIILYYTIPFLCCSHVVGALFGFRQFDGTAYSVNEDQESLEVNVGLIEGQLARDVTLLLTTLEQGQSAIGELLHNQDTSIIHRYSFIYTYTCTCIYIHVL